MLQTSRTSLRRFQLSDLNNMIALETDPEIMRFTPSRVPLSPEKIAERLKAQIEKQAGLEPLGVWAVELRGSAEFVGWFMLMPTEFEFPELGFMIVRKHWGKGFATEVSRSLVEHAFGPLGLKGLTAATDPTNHASMRVLEKLGFRFWKSITKFDKVLGRDAELSVFEFRG